MAEHSDGSLDEGPEKDPETGYAYGIDDMKWFDAAAGLRTMEALRSHVASTDVSGLDEEGRDMLLEELEDCIQKLEGPSKRGGKFNLPVVM